MNQSNVLEKQIAGVKQAHNLLYELNTNARNFIHNQITGKSSSDYTDIKIKVKDTDKVDDLLEKFPPTSPPPINMDAGDRLDREEIKRAVKDANADCVSGVGIMKDELDITLRAYRSVASVPFSRKKISCSVLPEDQLWLHTTSKGINACSSSVSLSSKHCNSLDYRCVLRSLSLP